MDKWTEQQMRLLRAAQDVVNDASDDGENTAVVSFEFMDALKAIIKEISEEAEAEITAEYLESRRLAESVDHERVVISDEPKK